MSRIAELQRDELTADGPQLDDRIPGARGSIAGPFRIWLHSPESTRRATQLGEFLRYHTSLSPRLSELVNLITARRQESETEWAIHKPARNAGLPVDIIEALHSDRRPTFAEVGEESIYDYCEQLHPTHTAEKAALRRVLSLAGSKAAVEYHRTLRILHDGRHDLERFWSRH